MQKTLLWLALSLCVAQCWAVGQDDASSNADRLRESVPRFVGPSEFSTSDQDYYVNLAIYFAIGVVLAVLTLLTCLCFALCRCCGWCVKPVRENGYNCRPRCVPWINLIIFCCLSAAFCSVGITENHRLSDTLQGDDSDAFTNFFPLFVSNTGSKLLEIRGLVVQLGNDTDTALNQASALLSNTLGVFAGGTGGLVTRLDVLASQLSNLTLRADCAECSGTVYNCSYCVTVGQTTQATANQIRAQTDSSLKTFNETVTNIQETMVSVRGDIVEKVNEVTSQINDLLDQYNDQKDLADDIVDHLKENDDRRNLGLNVLFVLPLLSFAIVVLASITRVGMCFKLNVWLAFLVGFFMWLLFGLHLPLAVVLGDVCVRIETEELALYNKTDDTSKVAVGCLQNTSLVEVFNATDQLNFANQVKFPASVNFSQQFSFSQLDSFVADVSALDVSTFGLNTSLLVAGVNAINSLIPAGKPCCFTLDNITLLDPRNYSSPLNETLATRKLQITQGLADQAQLQRVLWSMVMNVTAVANYSEFLKQLVIDGQKNVTQLEDLLTPFISAGQRFIDVATCGFLGNAYRSLKKFTCTDVMGHISTLGLALFVCGVCSIPVIVTSQISASRIPNPLKTVPVDEDVDEYAAGYVATHVHQPGPEIDTLRRPRPSVLDGPQTAAWPTAPPP